MIIGRTLLKNSFSFGFNRKLDRKGVIIGIKSIVGVTAIFSLR